jgi:hypothetical protein
MKVDAIGEMQEENMGILFGVWGEDKNHDCKVN